MAALTRKETKEYVRIKVKNLKNDALVGTFLDIEVNLSQRKVQKDLMSMDLKQFNRQMFGTGAYVAAPSDLLEVPNAIIDVKASTGARASVTTNFAGANNDITFTWNEPGTSGNITDVIAVNDGQSSGIVITTTFSAAGVPSFLVSFAPGAVASTVIAAINADNVMSLWVTAANKSGDTGAGTITLGVSVTHTTTGGTGTGWVPCDEFDITSYNRAADISLIAPSSTQPMYAKSGDLSGTQQLQFLPRSITYSQIYYKYRVADLTADTDVLSVGTGYEELVLLDMCAKAFGMLEEQAKMETQRLEYEASKNKYLKMYQESLGAMQQEKKRMETADRSN